MRTGSSTTSSDLGGSKRGETAARAQMQSSPAKAAATASYSSRKSGSSRAERGGDCGTGSGESSAHAKETPSVPLRPQHTASAHSLSKRSCGGGGGGDKSIPPRMSTHSLTDDPQVVVVMASRDFEDSDGIKHEKTEPIAYKESVIIGNGSFGIVYKAKLLMPFECSIAIKKVLQDKHFKNREVEIMRKIQHPNIVSLFYFFFSSSTSPTSPSDKKRISGSTRSQNANGDLYLNLILEYIPETAHRIIRCYARAKESIPAVYVKVYVYQLLRAIGYLHQIKICHRDIKPQNLLICPKRSILKLCDFGSAKVLANDSVNVSYICSRYYRAPELIFGAVKYTCSIDTWSVGCVFAELLLTRPVFPGDSGVNQLVEIIKILGTPTAEQIKTMNPHYECFKFPQIKSSPWNSVFPHKTPTEAIDLIRKLLEYTPTERINPIRALLHPFFDDLRNPATRLPYKKELPPIFNFSPLELSVFDGDPNRESLTRIIDPTRNGLAPGNDNLPPPPPTTTILPSSNGLNNE